MSKDAKTYHSSDTLISNYSKRTDSESSKGPDFAQIKYGF